MATRYSKTAQTGDQGVAIVAKLTSQGCGIFRPFQNADIGIDGAIELLTNDKEPSGDIVLTQIKAGPSYIRRGEFFIDADKDHFETWSRYALPIVGIVCDVISNEARWVDISDHLRKHPERISNGPYSIKAPSSQLFAPSGFPDFLKRFRRSSSKATYTDTTPNLLIRAWEPRDAVPTRALLTTIGFDYPKFDDWLTRKFNDSSASKKVVDVNDTIAAFSMSQLKDERNAKLQTFIVAPQYRGTAIGSHLLYHELRTWAKDPLIERSYVTVASSKSDLIDFFLMFGFRVEGIAPNRYVRPSQAAELVLTKHFIREIVRTPQELAGSVAKMAKGIWGIIPPGAERFGVSARHLAIPAVFPKLEVVLNESESTVAPRLLLLDVGGQEVLRHNDETLMREFYPLRLHLKDKRYVLVPIYQEWADAMLSTSGPHTPLKLRVDNVYYCYPKVSNLAPGDFVVFYEPSKNGGRKAAIGTAIVQEVAIDTPAAIHARYKNLGIYNLTDVTKHTNSRGHAMAIKFGLFEPFEKLVSLSVIRMCIGKMTNVQGLTRIDRDGFEQIRMKGI